MSICLSVLQVTSESDVKHAIQVAREKFGGLNVAVNCAGIGIAKRTLTKKGPHPLEDFQRVLNVNTVGSFNVIRLAAELMAAGQPYNKGGEKGQGYQPFLSLIAPHYSHSYSSPREERVKT